MNEGRQISINPPVFEILEDADTICASCRAKIAQEIREVLEQFRRENE